MLPNDIETLPERFVWARKNKGLSQEVLAGLLSVSQGSIEKLENGKVRKPKYLPEAARVLGVSYDWLLNNVQSNNDWEEQLLDRLRQLGQEKREVLENMLDLLDKD